MIVGHEGVRVTPLERPEHLDVFGFMGAQVSSERPHGHLIAGIARRMQALRKSEAKILLAGGPAIIHGGGREPLAWLIEAGYIHVLFCGNALAAHDMEAHLYGTSLGLLVRMRDLLPGRYAFGLTGRDPQGNRLPAGEYTLTLTAIPPGVARRSTTACDPARVIETNSGSRARPRG